MKKIILFSTGATLFLITSCISVKQQTAQKMVDGSYIIKAKNSYDFKLTVITIDSCEYLMGGPKVNTTTLLTHKGNCKYCAARPKIR